VEAAQLSEVEGCARGIPLPTAGSPGFRVLFRGRNIVAEDPNHPGHAARLGFWATCHVVARDADAAQRAAFDLIYADDELKSLVRNPPGSPPVVDLEHVVAVHALPKDRAVAYDWFSDEGSRALPEVSPSPGE
jgi:hypothetical protein